MPGPKWLGIGAQRSGTDWVSRLLTQHPKVGFGTNDKKEQQALQRVPDGRASEEEYLGWFPDDGILRGDWSPRYMPLMVVPQIARRVLPDEAPIFVLLRDPVERLGSAMRFAKKKQAQKRNRKGGGGNQRGKKGGDFNEAALSRAHQFGQYASALEGWATAFSKERFVVLTYEEAKEDVEAACKIFWSAMGVEPHKLKDPYERVKAPTEGAIEWDFPEGMRAALVGHYLPQVHWLRDQWGVDVKRWRSFDGLV